MANPWDRPPRPIQGDATDSILYEWIGRNVIHWEHIEWQLARLYSAFFGKLDDGALMREYGAGQIFRLRLTALKRAAESYFMRHCNQYLEAEFDKLCMASEGFADRRNEVAHGVVVSTRIFHFFAHLPKDTWVLVPPFSEKRNFDDLNIPKYMYTSRELNVLILNGGRLHEDIDKLLNTIIR
jgi:hypothetical protein